LVVAGLGFQLVAGAAAQPPSTVDDVEGRTAVIAVLDNLVEADLAKFMHGVVAANLRPPTLDSEWRVSRMPESLSKGLAESERRLGFQLAKRIDERVPVLWSKDIPLLATEVDALLDLADWVGRNVAFGNAVLQREAREVALVGLARMAADPGVAVD